MFIVVEARIEARLSKLETRVSSIKLRVSIRASSPLNVKLSHETGLVAVTFNTVDRHRYKLANVKRQFSQREPIFGDFILGRIEAF